MYLLWGTKLNDEFVLRACLINHRKQKSSVEFLLATIRRVAEGVIDGRPGRF